MLKLEYPWSLRVEIADGEEPYIFLHYISFQRQRRLTYCYQIPCLEASFQPRKQQHLVNWLTTMKKYVKVVNAKQFLDINKLTKSCVRGEKQTEK